MNDALAKRADLVRTFIDERVHPAIGGTKNRDRFASLYRQRTRAKSRQLVNRANIKPFCGHGSTSSNDRERPDFCYVLVQVPLGARCTLRPRVLLQEALGMKEARAQRFPACSVLDDALLDIIQPNALHPRGGTVEITGIPTVKRNRSAERRVEEEVARKCR